MGQQLTLCNFQAVTPERTLLKFGIHVTSIIMLAMTTQTQQAGNDELRPMPFASASDSAAYGFKTSSKICSVHRVTLNTVTLPLVRQRAARKLARRWSRVSVLIVCDH